MIAFIVVLIILTFKSFQKSLEMSDPRKGQSKGVKSPKVILDTRDKKILWNIIKSSNGGKVRKFILT